MKPYFVQVLAVENPEDLLRGLGDFVTWMTQPVASTKDSPKALGTTGNPTASKDIAVIGGAVISDALLNVLEKSKVEETSGARTDAEKERDELLEGAENTTE